MAYVVTAVLAALAGIVQGVTGFGAGIVIMLGLPFFFPLAQSAGMAGAIAMALCVSMVWRYRADISLRKALTPTLPFLVICSLTINFATMVPQEVTKRIFGVFLLLLACYYLFFNTSDGTEQLSLPVQVACIVISALCDGLFGIGGPLMVLYFMACTASTREYLGTLQLFFLVNSLYNTVFRIWRGILGPENLVCIGVGAAGILAGLVVANRLVDKLDANVVRKLTYTMIGVAGVVNLLP